MNDVSFAGKKILITGATGLIGKAVVEKIREKSTSLTPAHLFLVVRDIEKAEKIFQQKDNLIIDYIVSDIKDFQLDNLNIDYIIHGASNTSSISFVKEPVEVIQTAIQGTTRLLEFARCNPVESFVYLSSMEVYGVPHTDEKITETYPCNLNCMEVRSAYPESKRMCENLCAAYCSEYGVPTKVIRLAQTFGPGVNYNDKRVFAEFARCVIEKRNIILKTKGDTKRSYLGSEDAAEAILYVLINGKEGEAYNAANEQTYCSILEMAQMVISASENSKLEVEIQEEDISKYGYANTLKLNLDTSKLRALGWQPKMNLEEMYQGLINDMNWNRKDG